MVKKQKFDYVGDESTDFKKGAYKRFKESYSTKGKDLGEILRDFKDWQRRDRNTLLQEKQITIQVEKETNVIEVKSIIRGKEQTRYRNIVTGKFISTKDIESDKLNILTYDEWKERRGLK